MRKQYHFRPSERGLLAWDVHRLIELSKQLPVIEVLLSSIQELEEAYWFDMEGKPPTCKAVVEHAQLMRDVDITFPIVLFSDGRVADGMHRVCRAWMDGRNTIRAVQFSEDPTPDYVGCAPDALPYDA